MTDSSYEPKKFKPKPLMENDVVWGVDDVIKYIKDLPAGDLADLMAAIDIELKILNDRDGLEESTWWQYINQVGHEDVCNKCVAWVLARTYWDVVYGYLTVVPLKGRDEAVRLINAYNQYKPLVNPYKQNLNIKPGRISS